jgi:ubiquitin carboxyl-terminal hydrolase 7
MFLCHAIDEAMKEIVLPPLLDEPKILEDFTHTWTVDNWRSLGKREHGPIFQAGGFPWYVILAFLSIFPFSLRSL